MAGREADPFALVGTTLERRYSVERAIARGGFAAVYLARHVALKRPVALKVLVMPPRLGLREKRLFLEGFEREAQLVAALEHPAVVRAYDFGITRPTAAPELPWLAMEWVEGETLKEHLDARPGVRHTPGEALGLLRPVFQALAYAHGERVAHRDVKPANVMLTGARAEATGVPTARLLDFGIAKAMSPEEVVGTGETRTLGAFRAFSPGYAAPEQKAGTRTGPWTDVHALGLVLTELLVGRRPYPEGDRLALDQAIVSPRRPTPAAFGVDVGPWEPVLERALSLRPPERFQDAASLLQALEGVSPRGA